MRWFGKIRVQLVAIMLICYLIPTLVLGFYMGGVVLRDLQAKTDATLIAGMEYSMKLAEENLQKITELAWDATYDGELPAAADDRDAGILTDGAFLRLARNYIERKYSRESMLTFAACFTMDNPDLLMVNRSGMEEAAVYQATAHEAVKAMSSEIDAQNHFIRLGDRIYLVRNLINLRMRPYGMLVLGIDMDRLTAPLTELAGVWKARLDLKLDSVSLEDATGTGEQDALPEAWDALPENAIAPLARGRFAVCRSVEGRNYDLWAGLIIGRQQLYGELDAFRLLLAGLIALLAPILVIIAWYVYRRITKPIAILAEASRRIEAGELGVTVPMRSHDELGQLGKAFSNMSLRLEELIDKTYKEEIALRDARIQAMQSRINPHFINNALETINWQARIEGSETISSMVESLSVLLNAGMSRNDRHMLSLREELETARAYFYFVSLRFGDRLTTHIDVAPEALDAIVPALTIQPLIENAVEHGISPEGGGTIELNCLIVGDSLRVMVANSGRAATEEDRRRMAEALAGNSQGGAHLGMANISTRLHLIYGGRAAMKADTDARGQTRVIVDIPQDAAERGVKR